MTHFSINGLIAFFDLRNILCDSSKNRHELIFELALHHDIKISFFNNFYYFIDFSACKLLSMQPILNCNTPDDFKKAEESIAINLQKEAINAINALIYNEQRIEQHGTHYSNILKRTLISNDIDQFMIPHTSEKLMETFDYYIKTNASFSSEAYKIACEAVIQKEPSHINCLESVTTAITKFNQILQSKDCNYNIHPFYILSNLWKGIYYINHDLRIDASIQLRSVFESLVRSKFNLSNQKIDAKNYTEYCETKEINDFFVNNRESRHNSVHDLLIPSDIKALRQYAKHLVDFFERDFEIKVTGILK